jgi:uncharacterized protein YyaL (SSP411 family)
MTEGGRENRLARESSPYLLLHARNPVDWFPWGEEAFAKARDEDKPIFLSVGYSTCYWCHVMERESFSNAAIAEQLNAGFVPIKLDREERPELDEIYMTATQMMTRSGGWPNSVFLTHDLKPFFAGTYFPPADWHGRPGFPKVLTAIREAWDQRRPSVLEQAEVVSDAIREQLGGRGEPRDVDAEELTGATLHALEERFDPEWGGFGQAPKFPSPSNLYLLLELAQAGDQRASEMLVVTLDRMARGGIHDQLAGGFHRYSTDEKWLVPHFEKMLYDNAALAPLFALAAELAPASFGFARVARRTLDFVRRELTSSEGGFLSAIDAETDGHEGAYYTWTKKDLESALDKEQLALVELVYGCDGAPTFEEDRYVLYLPKGYAERAAQAGLSEDELLRHLDPAHEVLLVARARRKRPLVDDKVLCDWNGQMIAAMAIVGQRLAEPNYVDVARSAAVFVLEHLRDPSGRLLHSYRNGQAKVPALLDDYAFLIQGLLALHDATGESRWRQEAERLSAEQEERLGDSAGGYFAAPEDPRLLFRAKAAHDGAMPSGNGVSVLNLIALGKKERAAAALRAFGGAITEYPLAHVTLVQAARRLGSAGAVAVPAPPAAVAPARVDPRREAAGVVEVTAWLDPEERGGWRRFALELGIRAGWHLNANPASRPYLIATEVKAGGEPLRSVKYPAGTPWTQADTIAVYSGAVHLEGEVQTKGRREAEVVLVYQPCDEDRCLERVTRSVPLAVASSQA